MSNETNIEAIKLLATGIEKHIDSLNMLYSDNLYEYRLKDFLNINNVIKVCSRCGKVFVPKFGFATTQQYCGDDCRYNSTRANRKIIKQDEKYHRIDCLRKLIYERKYRAKRDNKSIPMQQSIIYEQILIDLKSLTKARHTISDTQFNQTYNELHNRYKLSKDM